MAIQIQLMSGLVLISIICLRLPQSGRKTIALENHAATLVIDLATGGIPANNLRNFDVEQMRRVQCL